MAAFGNSLVTTQSQEVIHGPNGKILRKLLDGLPVTRTEAETLVDEDIPVLWPDIDTELDVRADDVLYMSEYIRTHDNALVALPWAKIFIVRYDRQKQDKLDQPILREIFDEMRIIGASAARPPSSQQQKEEISNTMRQYLTSIVDHIKQLVLVGKQLVAAGDTTMTLNQEKYLDAILEAALKSHDVESVKKILREVTDVNSAVLGLFETLAIQIEANTKMWS